MGLFDMFRKKKESPFGDEISELLVEDDEVERAFRNYVKWFNEPITNSQQQFLSQLGIDTRNVETKREARLFITRILRPVNYLLSKTFKNKEALTKESLRALQVALVKWEYYPNLPRYGPEKSWADLEQEPNYEERHHRPFTKEERISATDIAFQVLPPEQFLALGSMGVKKHKDLLDAQIKGI
ncbi:hypothetical protein N9L71_11745 [Verrucomicrobiales bacterium]|nr:hypothetical protein [Verrucomicrobiales bacterium]